MNDLQKYVEKIGRAKKLLICNYLSVFLSPSLSFSLKRLEIGIRDKRDRLFSMNSKVIFRRLNRKQDMMIKSCDIASFAWLHLGFCEQNTALNILKENVTIL